MYEYQIVINTLVPARARTVKFDEVNEANSAEILRIRFHLSQIRPETAFLQFAQRLGVKKLVFLIGKEWPGLMFEPEDFGGFPDDFVFAIYTDETWRVNIMD